MAVDGTGFLDGLRVVELADELGEYCGGVLARLGAEVIKVEPPGGEVTRGYGPFYRDVAHLDRSLHFWHYNLAKKSVVLDLDDGPGQADFRRLVANADVLIDTRSRHYLADRGLGGDQLRTENPALIYTRLSPFGDAGPWADLRGSDLVHLALGGVMMNCGYSPDPAGYYDTPPIAPQMWQSYHIAGEVTVIAILGALAYRDRRGVGQQVSTSVHEAVSKCTETDLPSWVYLRRTHRRQTCRHSLPGPGVSVPSLAMTKDGRWLMPYATYLPGVNDGWDGLLELLGRHGMADDLAQPAFADAGFRLSEPGRRQTYAAVSALAARLKSDRELWRDAQQQGLPWAPLRTPEENLADPHWDDRETFVDVHHPELGQTFRYVGRRWVAPGVSWRLTPRPPLLGEHTAEVLAATPPVPTRPVRTGAAAADGPVASDDPAEPLSPHGKPFALHGVRVVDLGWLLASAGAGRFLAALGAEVIKVEHLSRLDIMRYGAGMAPAGGRAAREAATGEIPPAPADSPNRCGAFMEINAGKRGISLNLKHEQGKELLRRLIADADVLIEGYSPGTLERMGFGYDVLRALNPRLVYVQQSGLGQAGRYGRLRSFGPTAQAFSGLSEMSGLPAPYPPAGIGYSYLDWFGAYNVAIAALAGLQRRERTGEGCHIDSSQTEIGLYLTGTAVLDYSANGRPWSRVGNRSPGKPAAPCGTYPVRGEDRWLALSCFDEDQWTALVRLLGTPEWAEQPRFRTLATRLTVQDELDELIAAQTRHWDGTELMAALQSAGVPAGVCQTAEDRCDNDPQLRHDGWLVELPQSEIGTWPVREMPFRLSETPPFIGGPTGRSGPNYGEDTRWLLRERLGCDDAEIDQLYADGVV